MWQNASLPLPLMGMSDCHSQSACWEHHREDTTLLQADSGSHQGCSLSVVLPAATKLGLVGQLGSGLAAGGWWMQACWPLAGARRSVQGLQPDAHAGSGEVKTSPHTHQQSPRSPPKQQQQQPPPKPQQPGNSIVSHAQRLRALDQRQDEGSRAGHSGPLTGAGLLSLHSRSGSHCSC